MLFSLHIVKTAFHIAKAGIHIVIHWFHIIEINLFNFFQTFAIGFYNLFKTQNLQTMKASPQLPTRVVLYTKDIENITGCRSRTARKLINKIRTALGKSKEEFITIKEFSFFTGIDEDLIKDFL
jgi:hypothetical protein